MIIFAVLEVAGVGEAHGKYQLTELFEGPQRYRQWEYLAGDGCRFCLRMPKGMVLRIDGSMDLRGWQGILSTNTLTGP